MDKSGFETLIKSKEERIAEAILSIPDDFAKNISWRPLNGSSVFTGPERYVTSFLVQKLDGNLEYKVSKLTVVFSLLLMAPIFFLGYIFYTSKIFSDNAAFPPINKLLILLPFLTIPGLYFFLGVYKFIKYNAAVVFDKNIRYFYKGTSKKNGGIINENDEKYISFSKIHALQIVQKIAGTRKSSYYSYELNLVLKDATRINVVDHGNLKVIQSDAKMIGDFLNVSVWDLTSFNLL